ncbi:MAG: glycosyltransferase family 2 protein [Clostridia bacterium]|nr:glycosyltransferase family 2 protein [Clostridia bacterium]
MEQVLVSVIVPCYQNGATLEKTVRSIQAQTYRAWELICVNDGSKDDTGEVLDRLAMDEPRMRVIHQDNGGVSAARNAGLAAAKGEWVTFVDADDWLLVDAISRMLALADDQADIVCGAYAMRYIDENRPQEVYTCRSGDYQAVIESLIRGDSALNSMCARLYRREMLIQHRILAPVGVKIGEDVLFNLEAFSAARSWKISEDVIYIYEFGGDSAMTRARTNVYQKTQDMILGIDRFLEKRDQKTQFFRAHIDIYIRTLRADRGRLKAALSLGYRAVARMTRGVHFSQLDAKQKAYYLALRLMPALSYFLP